MSASDGMKTKEKKIPFEKFRFEFFAKRRKTLQIVDKLLADFLRTQAEWNSISI